METHMVTEPCPAAVHTGQVRKRLDRGIEVCRPRIRDVNQRWLTVAMFTGAQAFAVSRLVALDPIS